MLRRLMIADTVPFNLSVRKCGHFRALDVQNERAELPADVEIGLWRWSKSQLWPEFLSINRAGSSGIKLASPLHVHILTFDIS